jgi:hypothetical protein
MNPNTKNNYSYLVWTKNENFDILKYAHVHFYNKINTNKYIKSFINLT